MMKQEFEERANLKVSLGCYHSLIEPGYNASKLDKDEWVKEWKKNGGVQAAYDWEKKRAKSHPSWVCGLKLAAYHPECFRCGHTLRGCVD